MRALIMLLLLACSDDRDRDGFNSEEDCDDDDADVFPGADEWCDDVDNDCDLLVDEPEARDATAWWADQDQDGYGSTSFVVRACVEPAGFTGSTGDCDDAYAAINPGATEIPENDLDDDCDPATAD